MNSYFASNIYGSFPQRGICLQEVAGRPPKSWLLLEWQCSAVMPCLKLAVVPCPPSWDNPEPWGPSERTRLGENHRIAELWCPGARGVGAHRCLSPAFPVSTELSQGCARGCDLCSEFNGCLRCSPKLFILLERNDIRQIGICLPSCPLGYFGLRNTDMNKCISEYQWSLRAAGRSWCSSPLPIHGHEAAL